VITAIHEGITPLSICLGEIASHTERTS
jgi:hypothetical protein